MKKLQQAGIFELVAKGNYNQNTPITRAEMAKALTIAFDLEVKVELDFMDVPKDHPANKYVRVFYSNGITTGERGFYNLEAPVTRVYYAVFLHRLLHMDDPIDPAEPAEKIRRKFAGIFRSRVGERLRHAGQFDAANASAKSDGQSSQLSHYERVRG